jgi:hypothetical protein
MSFFEIHLSFEFASGESSFAFRRGCLAVNLLFELQRYAFCLPSMVQFQMFLSISSIRPSKPAASGLPPNIV